MASNRVTRQISIFINDKEVVNSLQGVTREMRSVNNQLRNLNAGSETYEQDVERLQGELRVLTERQSEFREELYDTEEAMGAAAGAWTNLLGGLMSGNLNQAAVGLTALKAGIIATTKAMFAFIATPIGATIVALAGIALATKEWFEYNKEVVKANRETEAITKLSGDALNNARVQAEALATTFDVDFKEVLETSRALVNEFGISYTEALDQIQVGLVKGGAANGEFLESMREYPTFFKQAGFTVSEFQNMVNTGIDLGIYSDKLPDAIKEFALSVTEQTPAVREALENAFGTEFTTKLLKGVKDGSLTVKDALTEISNEAERLGLNSQQAQQLTADLFRGAGEDAGGAIKIFNAVTQSIENQKRPLSEVEQAVKDLAESELALAEAQDAALRSEGFEVWANNVSIFLNDVKKGFYDLVFVITNSQEELNALNESDAKKKGNKQWAEDSLATFKDYVERRKKSMGELYDFEKVKEEYLTTVRNQQKGTWDTDEKEKLQGEIDIIVEYGKKRTEVTNKNNIDDIKARTAANKKRLKEIEDQQKKEMEANRRVLETWAENYLKAEQEINDLIAKSQTEREANKLKGLNKEIYQIQAKYATEIQKYKEHTDRLLELEQTRDAEIAAVKAAKAQEYGLQIDEINAMLDRDREALRLDKAANEAVEAEDKQAILLEKAKFLADWEIQTEMEKELAKVEDVENAESMKQAIRDKYALKKEANDQKFAEAEKIIKKDIVDWTRLTEEQKLQLTKNALNGAAEAFNKGSGAWKAIKIAETSITTYQAAMSSYNSLAGIPVVGPALGAAAAALAVVTGMKQIQNISKTKIAKAPSFFKGGDTGNTPIGYDQDGKVVGYVHEDEWVAPKAMRQNPRYANVFGWLENERLKLKGYFGGGNVTNGSGDAPAIVNDPQESDILTRITAAIDRLNQHIDNGIKATTIFGYQEVNELGKMSNEIKLSSNNGKMNS